jgi:L-2,4-diaminobutyrate decarboxylase
MHGYTEQSEAIAQAVVDYSIDRMRLDPVPLDGPKSPELLREQAGQTVTGEGLGWEAAMRIFADVLAPACLSIDHPRYLSFIPCAPTEAASLFDLVVSASSLYGGSWLEGSGAVYAENQALRWIADLAGLPEQAGGVFVQGGTLGNLSALVAARYGARRERAQSGRAEPSRWRVAAASTVHSSVVSAAAVMDVDVLSVPVNDSLQLSAPALEAALDATGPDGRPVGESVFAVVASGGTTNLGIVDDLASVADVCSQRGIWMHVDGAYGGAALAAPSVRDRFDGVERCDSFVVDPHKWLFGPFDACALVYREPAIARAAHTQQAGYLDPLHTDREGEWNPSDYAVHLTRRARGLPLWFSLATHGTDAYATAVERTLSVARYATAEIRRRQYVELVVEPMLSVVAFRRIGWTSSQYQEWSERLVAANFAFVTPSSHEGETIARFAVVNPRTTEADISLLLDTMA